MNPEGFDVAVVGAGTAGCVVARRLSESGERSVILLEAGPDPGDDPPTEWRDGWRLPTLPDWGSESEPGQSGQTTRLRRGRLLGGTSWLTRFAVRGVAVDFDAWAARGNPGWSYADVLPAFRRLEADAEFGTDPWHGATGPIPITRYPGLDLSAIHSAAVEAFAAAGVPMVDDHNAPHAVGVGRLPMSSRDGARVTTVDAYLPGVTRAGNLDVRTDAPVATVMLDGNRAIGVRLVDGTAIRAGWIVIAAGTYGSPAILMRSGIGPAAHLRTVGIDALIDLPGVGTNLADHPGVDLDTGWRGSGGDGPVLHSIATLRTAAGPADGSPDLMFWTSDPDGDEPGFWLDPVLLKPQSRGSVTLRSTDPSARPRITLPGIREPADVTRLIEGYARGLEFANRPEIRQLATLPAPTAPTTPRGWRRHIIDNAYSIPHVVGTCAMGTSPADGAVVDPLGRVYGTERLSIADASIIPDPPVGFPYLITIMLAEHISERLPAHI